MAKEKVLKEIEKSIAVGTQKAFDPKEFFKDREGLWVGSSFESKIVEKAEPSPAELKLEVASYVLEKDATDEDIEKALPKEHLFSELEVCIAIASLIEKQPKGEDGALLNTGDWNLFYTASCVVDVSWDSSGRFWVVSAWGRGVNGWHAGERVFSPVN